MNLRLLVFGCLVLIFSCNEKNKQNISYIILSYVDETDSAHRIRITDKEEILIINKAIENKIVFGSMFKAKYFLKLVTYDNYETEYIGSGALLESSDGNYIICEKNSLKNFNLLINSKLPMKLQKENLLDSVQEKYCLSQTVK